MKNLKVYHRDRGSRFVNYLLMAVLLIILGFGVALNFNACTKLSPFEQDNDFTQIDEVVSLAKNNFNNNNNEKIGSSNSNQSFDFNDGTIQGWTMQGAYDEYWNGPLQNQLELGWVDVVNYPNPAGRDPKNDQNGSLSMSAEILGISQPGANYWTMQLISPDLSNSNSWQQANGYTVEIAQILGPSFSYYANLFVKVFDIDRNEERYFYNGDSELLPFDTWDDNVANWTHLSFDWSEYENFPTNYVVKQIHVNISGLISEGIFPTVRIGRNEWEYLIRRGYLCLDNVQPIFEPFSFSAPESIELIYPNGDETWYTGKTYDIKWIADRYTGRVKIEIYTDRLGRWTNITPDNGTSNDGLFSYTPENDKISSNCYIMVTSRDNPVASDRSNSAFVIRNRNLFP